MNASIDSIRGLTESWTERITMLENDGAVAEAKLLRDLTEELKTLLEALISIHTATASEQGMIALRQEYSRWVSLYQHWQQKHENDRNIGLKIAISDVEKILQTYDSQRV